VRRGVTPHQRIAVGDRPRSKLGPDRAVGAAAVFDDQIDLENFIQLV